MTTPLADLEYPKGVIFTPDIVYCAECGAQLTIQTRIATKVELKKLAEKKEMIDQFRADMADEGLADREEAEAIEIAGEALAGTVHDITAAEIDGDETIDADPVRPTVIDNAPFDKYPKVDSDA